MYQGREVAHRLLRSHEAGVHYGCVRDTVQQDELHACATTSTSHRGSERAAMNVTLVTITNAKRWHLLERTLRAALENGADRAVLVDNEAQEEIASRTDQAFPGRVHTIRLEHNQGSAGAYCAGLQAAMETGAEFLLLLDDDNCVEPQTIPVLQETYKLLSATTPPEQLCVVGFRPDHMSEILRGRPHELISSSGDAFFMFHMADLPKKLWKWISGRRQAVPAEAANPPRQLFRQRTAPFGGMFFHRSVIERHGLPDRRFVLYQDDIEFSYRISSTGGEIVVAPQALIADLEQSWGIADRSTIFGKLINLGSDRQVYYTTRNRAYFESHCREHSRIRKVNRAVFLFTLWSLACLRRRTARFRLIVKAIHDGEGAVLGINPEFPLSG